MPIKIVQSIVHPHYNETLDELTERTHMNLCIFSNRHLDYSAVIEEHVDENYIVVKSLMLKESAN